MAEEMDIQPVMAELLRINAAIAQLHTSLSEIKQNLATLNSKTDSNAKAIEEMRAQIGDMVSNGVKVRLG